MLIGMPSQFQDTATRFNRPSKPPTTGQSDRLIPQYHERTPYHPGTDGKDNRNKDQSDLNQFMVVFSRIGEKDGM